eukprot:3200511-Amphidinium_carterae.1
MAERRLWKIVGGEDKGGVLVRYAKELASAKLPERLSTGAIVQQLALEMGGLGERLCFRRLTGSGPERGWISIALDHKVLAVPYDGSNTEEEEEQPQQTTAEVAGEALPLPPIPE